MKKIISIAILIALSLALGSCGSGKKQELVVYLSLLPSEEKIYKELIERFEYVTGAEVTLVSQQYNQIKQAIVSEVKAGKGVVDVFETDVYYLKDIADYTSDLKELEDFPRAELSRANQIDASLLENDLRYSIWRLEELQEWAWNPTAYTRLTGNAMPVVRLEVERAKPGTSSACGGQNTIATLRLPWKLWQPAVAWNYRKVERTEMITWAIPLRTTTIRTL